MDEKHSDQHDCEDLVSTLSDYVDGELDPSLCVALEAHLKGCHNCRVVVDTLKKTIELYHSSAAAETVPPDVRERLFVRLNLEEYLKK